jgi:hypothetical protein
MSGICQLENESTADALYYRLDETHRSMIDGQAKSGTSTSSILRRGALCGGKHVCARKRRHPVVDVGNSTYRKCLADNSGSSW